MAVGAEMKLGAWVDGAQTHFRVWAPKARTVEVVGPGGGLIARLEGDRAGYFAGATGRIKPNGRYRYRLDGGDSWPDPASRWQPKGVHGPSSVVDPSRFAWTDAAWLGPDRDRMVIYELHVGTFTPEGTYAGVMARLPDLVDLGVTVVELLPLNACDGRWNWGYDGAALFAPHTPYGTPEELRALIDRAHALGLGVILDVVYNHFGPAGNYTAQFSDDYVRSDVITAWGPAINLQSPSVREFFIENARHWINEYHCDGFRVDATHAFVDDGPRPFLAEFAESVRASTDRKLVLIAEDHRNLNTIIKPKDQGGWDFDGVWSDDFHHIMRRYQTGDHDGIYQDFEGTAGELANTIYHGWLKTGEWSAYRRKNRGTSPRGIPLDRFVFCLQNHDRVGNRGRGDRLHHAIDAASYRAATAALLLAPETPMLFMGQEWAASTPFHYFTDHAPDLGHLIQAGRAREFALYDDFNTPEKLLAVPDPQNETTFTRSRLDWSECDHPEHARVLRWHKALLRHRRNVVKDCLSFVGLTSNESPRQSITWNFGIDDPWVFVNFRGTATFPLAVSSSYLITVLLSSEDPEFASDPAPMTLEPPSNKQRGVQVWTLRFERPGAVILDFSTRRLTRSSSPRRKAKP